MPLDIRALRALRSPFEIDLYVWLTSRFFRLRRRVTIPWQSLMLQFGCGYSNLRHFRNGFSTPSGTSCCTTRRADWKRNRPGVAAPLSYDVAPRILPTNS